MFRLSQIRKIYQILFSLEDFSLNDVSIHTFVNPYSIQRLANSDVDLKLFKIHSDGILLVKLAQLFGKNIERFSFDETSIAPIIYKYAKSNNRRIAIIGTQKDLIGETVRKIETEYFIDITYYRDGFIDENEMDEVYRIIKDLKIDLLIVGMGTPLQEKFIQEAMNSGWKGQAFTCGGYLHQTHKNIQYYPKYINKLNLRFLYRIFDEPKLIKRYLVNYTKLLLIMPIMYFFKLIGKL